jgi:hypothetical protein
MLGQSFIEEFFPEEENKEVEDFKPVKISRAFKK